MTARPQRRQPHFGEDPVSCQGDTRFCFPGKDFSRSKQCPREGPAGTPGTAVSHLGNASVGAAAWSACPASGDAGRRGETAQERGGKGVGKGWKVLDKSEPREVTHSAAQ